MYSDFLMHYGVKGMKWGIRRTPEQLGHIKKPKKSVSKNLSNLWKTKDTNIYYITGISGSGKSTVALNNKDKNTSIIHLDSYFDNLNGPRSKRFNQYLNKNGFDYKKLINKPNSNEGWQEWGKNADKFESLLEEFGQDQFKKNRKVICEGVQLLDGTIYPDKKKLKGKPITILTTSIKASSQRSRLRDDIKDKNYKSKEYIQRNKQANDLVDYLNGKRNKLIYG